MKRYVLALLLLVIVAHFPWRLAAVTVEAMLMTPGPYRPAQTVNRYWDELALEARVTELGYAVGVEKNLRVLTYGGLVKAWGATDKEEHTVQLEAELKWDARLAVLAHEAGHILQPHWVNHEQEEAFAEAVATLVSRDGFREHARYLSRHKLALLTVLLTETSAIYHAAAVLEDR